MVHITWSSVHALLVITEKPRIKGNRALPFTFNDAVQPRLWISSHDCIAYWMLRKNEYVGERLNSSSKKKLSFLIPCNRNSSLNTVPTLSATAFLNWKVSIKWTPILAAQVLHRLGTSFQQEETVEPATSPAICRRHSERSSTFSSYYSRIAGVRVCLCLCLSIGTWKTMLVRRRQSQTQREWNVTGRNWRGREGIHAAVVQVWKEASDTMRGNIISPLYLKSTIAVLTLFPEIVQNRANAMSPLSQK